ncbi:MLO-like protein 6 [Asparagus officinalis]|nr:MLO-like protein 6 [Asparagus officinalis]
MVDIILTVGISILVLFLSAYVTLPLYALVTQMCSSMKKTVFTDDIVTGLKTWHKMAKKSLSRKKSIPTTRTSVMTMKFLSENIGNKKSFPTSHLMKPLPSPRIDVPLPRTQSSVSEFRYPSGRLELLEMQRVAEEIIECSSKNIPFDGEISFRLWKKQGEPSK